MLVLDLLSQHYLVICRITHIPSVLSQQVNLGTQAGQKSAFVADLQRTELEVRKKEAETLKSVTALKGIKEDRDI